MKLYKGMTIEQLQKANLSKGEVFNDLECSFDTALPQVWLDDFADFCKEYHPKVTYHLILSSTVFVYCFEKVYTGPLTCCDEVSKAYRRHVSRINGGAW